MNLDPHDEASRRPDTAPQPPCKRKGDAGYPGQVLRGLERAGAVSKLDDASSSCRADAGQAIQGGRRAGSAEVGAGRDRDGGLARWREGVGREDAGSRAGAAQPNRSRLLRGHGDGPPASRIGQFREVGRPAGERHVRGDAPQQSITDPGNAVEAGQGAEGTVARPVLDDPARESRAHAWQPPQLLGSGPVGIDPLPLGQRSGEVRETVAPRESGLAATGPEDGDGAWRRAAGNEGRAGRMSGNRKGEEQQDGTAFGGHVAHDGGSRAHRRDRIAARRGGKAQRRWAPSYFSPAFLITAIATSPTICRLCALTLSSVSSLVCQTG